MSTQVTNSEKVETTTTVPNETNSNAANMTNIPTNNKATKTSADLSKDVAQKVSGLKQLAPDWTYRRKLIFRSIYFCGGIISLISITLCAGLLLGYFHELKSPVDSNLSNLAGTLIYSITFFASGIIGAYCFGVAFETNSYRAHMTSMVTSIATSSPSEDKEKDN